MKDRNFGFPDGFVYPEWRLQKQPSKYRMDCFAKHPKINECSATTQRSCDGCAFYKTQEQHETDREKARQRCQEIGVEHDVCQGKHL